ncbi:Ger(x)C family spore germination protein [Lysinibacillus fusiformis]|uniref:Ger(x)C family spore germination protein n=1 Tax=Lysinibacillus fusiformis TaxID=28031 RepID=UPI002ECC1363|nr:Ger(x)C family spore germination protein [Lysinibacillus fusiformis]
MIKITKSKTILIFISFCILLSGCWSKRELNELAIVVAAGIDKVDNGFEVSVQIVNPSEISSQKPSSNQATVITYHSTGVSIFEAIRKLTTITPRKAYFAHLQVLILGDRLATEGINDVLDLFVRDPETRNDFVVVVSRESPAKEILNVLTPIEKIPANKIVNSLQGTEKAWGSTLSVNVDELATVINSERKSAVLPVIEIQGDKQLGLEKSNVEKVETPAILKYVGLAVFKQDRLIGVLSEEESKSFNFLNDNIKSTVVVFSCPTTGKLTTEITESTAKIKGKYKNNTPKININIHIDQNVGEVQCDLNLTDSKTIEYINKKAAQTIKSQIEETITTIQQSYKSDIVGFGELLYRENYKKWKIVKDDWSTIFPELEVEVEVYVNTSSVGTVNNWRSKK